MCSSGLESCPCFSPAALCYFSGSGDFPLGSELRLKGRGSCAQPGLCEIHLLVLPLAPNTWDDNM